MGELDKYHNTQAINELRKRLASAAFDDPQRQLRELLAEDVRRSLQRVKEPIVGAFPFPPSRKSLEEAAIRSADLKVESRDLRKELKARGIDRLAQTGELEQYLPDIPSLGKPVRREVPPLRKSRWPLAVRHYLADNPEFVGRGSFSPGIPVEDAIANYVSADMGAAERLEKALARESKQGLKSEEYRQGFIEDVDDPIPPSDPVARAKPTTREELQRYMNEPPQATRRGSVETKGRVPMRPREILKEEYADIRVDPEDLVDDFRLADVPDSVYDYHPRTRGKQKFTNIPDIQVGGRTIHDGEYIKDATNLGLPAMGKRRDERLYALGTKELSEYTIEGLSPQQRAIYDRMIDPIGMQDNFKRWREHYETLKRAGKKQEAEGVKSAMDLVLDQRQHARDYFGKKKSKAGSWIGTRLDPVGRATYWNNIDWNTVAIMLEQEPDLLHPFMRGRMQEILPHIEEGIAKQIKNPKLASKVLGAIKTAIKVAI
jgi:hypothetical protein